MTDLQIAFRRAALPGVGLYILPVDRVAPYDIRRMVSYEDTAPILTVIGLIYPSPHSPI
jgi:hypothetical protein